MNYFEPETDRVVFSAGHGSGFGGSRISRRYTTHSTGSRFS